MYKKPILLKKFRKDRGSTKASFISNVLIVERLVPIPRRNLKVKTQLKNTRKRKNPTTRKSFRKGKIIFTQMKKTTVHHSLVIVMRMNSFL
jgi:hypothetical protein